MMKRLIYTMLFLLCSMAGMAQTNEPLPSGAVQFSNQLWLNPADSTIWTGDAFEGKFVNLGSWHKVDSLLQLKADADALDDFYDKAQIDAFLALKADASALNDFYTKLEVDGLLDGYVPTSRQINGKALTGNITLNADDVGALQAGDNVSELTNDAGYITAGDIPAAPVTSVNGMTGAVTVAKADIGLGNVDNTSDANKPISTATQAALDGKENAFSKGSLIAGTGVTLGGTLTNRLVGSGDVTINATNPLTASNGLQISSGNISPIYGTSANTVAQGNDVRINNGQTAYGWGDYRQFGLGVETPYNITQISDWDSIEHVSFIRSSSAANTPFPQAGVAINIPHLSGGARFQLFAGVSQDGLYFRRRSAAGNWGSIREIWHSGNFTPPTSFTRTVPGLVPNPGGSGTTRFLREDGSWVVPDGGGGGGTATDLSIANRNANTLEIGSSTGTSATIPAATTSLSGLMTASDKSTLNSAITIETDPTVPAHVKGITSGNISNWNTAFNWGDYRQFGLGTSPNNITNIGDYDNTSRNTSFVRSSSAGNTPFGAAGTGIHVKFSENRGGQLWIPAATTSAHLQYRFTYSDNSWTDVRTVWDDANFNPSDYLQTSNFTWSNLSGKPSTFAPSAHTHNASDINSGTLAIARIPTGTTGSTVALGNHTHTFAAITSKPTTLAGYGITDGVPTSRTLTINGTTYNLSANRSWTLAASDVGAAPSSHVGAGGSAHAAVTTSTNGFMIAADKVKLDGIATGATANSPDATLLNRANHTGTQAISTVTGLQTALDGKQSTITGAATTITGSNLTTNRALISNGSGKVAVSSVTATELGYLAGVTSSVQTQLNNRVPTSRTVTVGPGLAGGGALSSNIMLEVDNNYVVTTSGNQTISGTKTFSSPVVSQNFHGQSTTASSNIPTDAHSLFKASISSNTNYTLTNLSGNPRQIQVMITNINSSPINVTFNANMSTSSQNPTIPGNSTVIFTFLVENGTAWGVKSIF